jgi:DNA polymerase I-like protein with 3'-5' exonuclease and polymerase domains
MRQTVHDEVDGDATAPETAKMVGEVLNHQSFNLKVPIMWNVSTGKNWAEAK